MPERWQTAAPCGSATAVAFVLRRGGAASGKSTPGSAQRERVAVPDASQNAAKPLILLFWFKGFTLMALARSEALVGQSGASETPAVLLYRLYFMNPVSGHIDRFLDFAAENNVMAIVAAHEHQGAAPLELWCGHKKICRIAPVVGRPSVTPRSSTNDDEEP